jgi:putative endonuclease
MFRFLQSLIGSKPEAGSGGLGEQLATEWLERERGFHVVTRNWRNPGDRREEIDLVARDRDVMVFVEVKARVAGALVPGYFAVDGRKKRILRRAIKSYLAQLRVKPATFRFDVVEVILPSAAPATNGEAKAGRGEPEILHFENVALFAKHFRA